MPSAWQAGGFVDHDQVLILINHRQFNGFRLIVDFRGQFHRQGQRLAAQQLVLGPRGAAVHRQDAFFDPGLQARPGEAVEQFGGRLVQPDTGVLRINLLSALNFLTAKMSHGPTCA